MSDTLDRIEYDLFVFTNNETGLTTFDVLCLFLFIERIQMIGTC